MPVPDSVRASLSSSPSVQWVVWRARVSKSPVLLVSMPTDMRDRCLVVVVDALLAEVFLKGLGQVASQVVVFADGQRSTPWLEDGRVWGGAAWGPGSTGMFLALSPPSCRLPVKLRVVRECRCGD